MDHQLIANNIALLIETCHSLFPNDTDLEHGTNKELIFCNNLFQNNSILLQQPHSGDFSFYDQQLKKKSHFNILYCLHENYVPKSIASKWLSSGYHYAMALDLNSISKNDYLQQRMHIATTFQNDDLELIDCYEQPQVLHEWYLLYYNNLLRSQSMLSIPDEQELLKQCEQCAKLTLLNKKKALKFFLIKNTKTNQYIGCFNLLFQHPVIGYYNFCVVQEFQQQSFSVRSIVELLLNELELWREDKYQYLISVVPKSVMGYLEKLGFTKQFTMPTFIDFSNTYLFWMQRFLCFIGWNNLTELEGKVATIKSALGTLFLFILIVIGIYLYRLLV